MFDFDASKLIIVGIIALIFIPPKDLPRVLRQAGQFVGKMRRMASEFQGQFMDAMREADMADLRNEARKLADSAKVETGLGSVRDINARLVDGLERKPAPPRPEVPPHAEVEPVPAQETQRETAETPREATEGVEEVPAKAPLPHSA